MKHWLRQYEAKRHHLRQRRNIIVRKHTSFAVANATSFICAPMMNDVFRFAQNEVLALLEMMLCLTAQMKKSRSEERDFLVETVGLEPMTPCMSSKCSNQLSYASATVNSITHIFRFVNPKCEKFLYFFDFFHKIAKKGFPPLSVFPFFRSALFS